MVDIRTRSEENFNVMKVIGEIDASSSIQLDEAIGDIISEGAGNLIVDCSELSYISSAGLGVFMSYIEEFRKQDAGLVIAGLNPKVRNVFDILGLDQLLTISDTVEDAKSSLS
ncbi:STAS domain-containing protein [Fulvivirga sedimenti]|uniref:Anti-sigma factor antagonist n=1 Tax=Fulvivirga sedimenti TaxID=2879465 RepID=A0A9X1HU10_9BACT|nr:STAS domain-containing protein [Fulvivirga sedimenti]MCA6078279.1 STAS domain-containing protein [Fulvivirga sedimenti]